jgi:hypothetical protein
MSKQRISSSRLALKEVRGHCFFGFCLSGNDLVVQSFDDIITVQAIRDGPLSGHHMGLFLSATSAIP